MASLKYRRRSARKRTCRHDGCDKRLAPRNSNRLCYNHWMSAGTADGKIVSADALSD